MMSFWQSFPHSLSGDPQASGLRKRFDPRSVCSLLVRELIPPPKLASTKSLACLLCSSTSCHNERLGLRRLATAGYGAWAWTGMETCEQTLHINTMYPTEWVTSGQQQQTKIRGGALVGRRPVPAARDGSMFLGRYALVVLGVLADVLARASVPDVHRGPARAPHEQAPPRSHQERHSRRVRPPGSARQVHASLPARAAAFSAPQAHKKRGTTKTGRALLASSPEREGLMVQHCRCTGLGDWRAASKKRVVVSATDTTSGVGNI